MGGGEHWVGTWSKVPREGRKRDWNPQPLQISLASNFLNTVALLVQGNTHTQMGADGKQCVRLEQRQEGDSGGSGTGEKKR